MDNRLPPQNIEAEKSILGGLMIEQDAWDEVSELLTDDDFYKPSHKKIYAAIRELRRRESPADLVTVSNYLMGRGELESVGGAIYLAEMSDQTPSAANIASYGKIVQDKSLLRKVISSGQGNSDLSLSSSPMTFVTLPVKIQSCQRYSSLIFSIGAGDGPRNSMRSPNVCSTRFAHCSAKNFSFS